MPTQPPIKMEPATLAFDKFWAWLQVHRNCILAAGTPNSAMYDADDFHWQFATENGTLVVQLCRGKDVIGEILIDPAVISYVQANRQSENDVEFDCVAELEGEQITACYFTMSHDYDTPETQPKKGRLVH